MNLQRTILAAAIAVGVTACEPPPPALSPDFGRSVTQNMSVHIVGPNLPAPDMDGNRAVLRQEQYRQGKVVPTREPGTTQTGTPTQPAPK